MEAITEEPTEQELALEKVQHVFGETAYTEDHINFRLVGYRHRSGTVQATGTTWDIAIMRLKDKANSPRRLFVHQDVRGNISRI
jgi:hypothetical protein